MHIITFVFKLIFSPFKFFYKLMFGKSRDTHFLLKPIKYCLWGFLGFMCIAIFIAALNEEDLWIGAWRKDGAYIIPVEIDPNELNNNNNSPEYNGDGSINGLNLQLIDSIQTEGFVKEYLTIARRSQNGELNDYPEHVTIGSIIGLAMGEQGGYPQSGYILPNTCLPWDSSTNSPKWDKSKNATLSLATASVFSSIGMNPSAGRVDSYVSPYQQTESYFTGGKYMPSNMLGYGMIAGRKTGDWTYFPDQLTGLDYEISNVEELDGSRLSAVAKAMNASENHNVGPGWKKQFLSVYKNGDYTEGLIQLEKEFSTGFTKLQSKLASEIIDPAYFKWVANFLLMENGWHVTIRQDDYTSNGGRPSYITMSQTNRNVCLRIFKMLGLGNSMEEMQSYLSAHLKNPTNYGDCLNATTQGTLWKDFGPDGRMFMLTETAGHILSSSFMGPIYYARMLQYAGVNVDPTDPNTYMNTIPNGEWKPGGDSVWMNNYPEIDKSKLNDKREKLLNEAYKWLGSWYTWGGTQPPEKDKNGNWINGAPTERDPNGNGSKKGFDCSYLTQYCVKTALGIDISRTTYTQIANPNLEPTSDPKPGDIMFIYKNRPSDTHHVGFYLGKNSDGIDLLLHSPQSKDVVKIGLYPTSKKVYYKVKGIDG